MFISKVTTEGRVYIAQKSKRGNFCLMWSVIVRPEIGDEVRSDSRGSTTPHQKECISSALAKSAAPLKTKTPKGVFLYQRILFSVFSRLT
jgi:hypothetical protein